nr:MAG TPA: hypothetical protein [Caudoviricetes sp.]
MCLDTACVGKATNWWECPIVSICGESCVPPTGIFRWHRRERC